MNLNNMKSDIVQTRIAQARATLEEMKKRFQEDSGVVIPSADISTLNKFIQEFNRSFTWYNQRSDLFEWLLPLIKLKSVNLGTDALKVEMKSLIGSNNLGKGFTHIEFSDILNVSPENLSTGIDAKDLNIQIADVRNKTDVIINYPIGDSFEDIAVSAKSVTGQHVKLVEATSLYRVLVFSQNYDFIKHYLNVISWSSNGGKAAENDILEANRLAKGLIMQLGAEGFDLNNPSQLLIVHNPKATDRKIKVYNLKALVYLIQREIINGNSKYKNVIRGLDDRYTIEQPFADTVEKRLNYLLQQINQVKVTAHIYGTGLNQYVNEMG